MLSQGTVVLRFQFTPPVRSTSISSGDVQSEDSDSIALETSAFPQPLAPLDLTGKFWIGVQEPRALQILRSPSSRASILACWSGDTSVMLGFRLPTAVSLMSAKKAASE